MGIGIVLAIIVVGIPIYFFATSLVQAPWGHDDIDSSVQRLVDDLSRKAMISRKITLGRRVTSDDTLHDSSWSGYFVYDCTLDGAPARVRITWIEVLGVNTVTKIERVDGDVGSMTIWDKSSNGTSR